MGRSGNAVRCEVRGRWEADRGTCLPWTAVRRTARHDLSTRQVGNHHSPIHVVLQIDALRSIVELFARIVVPDAYHGGIRSLTHAPFFLVVPHPLGENA